MSRIQNTSIYSIQLNYFKATTWQFDLSRAIQYISLQETAMRSYFQCYKTAWNWPYLKTKYEPPCNSDLLTDPSHLKWNIFYCMFLFPLIFKHRKLMKQKVLTIFPKDLIFTSKNPIKTPEHSNASWRKVVINSSPNIQQKCLNHRKEISSYLSKVWIV